MGMKCVEDPFNMGIFFFTKGVFHNGCIFRPPTHTSGHFILESPLWARDTQFWIPIDTNLMEGNIFQIFYVGLSFKTLYQ